MEDDLLLHLGGGIQGVIGRRERGHYFVAHGLDDGSVILVGRGAHHLDADADHFPGAQISKQFIELGAADDVGKNDGNFDLFSHRQQIILNLASDGSGVYAAKP